MKNLHDIIQKNSERFEKKVSKINYRDYGIDWDDIKHFLLSSQFSIIQAIDEWADKHQFQMDIKDYLPKVKAWQGGYDRPFDDGYAQAKLDLRSFLSEAKGHNNKLK